MSRPPILLVEWIDAHNGNHEWVTLESVPAEITPLVVNTVGVEIRRDEKHLTLSMTYADSRDEVQVCDLFTIPVSTIVKEVVLRARW